MKYIISLFLVLLLVSCQSDNKIQSITSNLLDQSNSEYSIISATGTKSPMIFALKSNGKSGSVEFWVDHYINGNYQGQILNLRGYTNDKKKETRLYLFSRNIDANDQTWTLSFRQDSENTVAHTALKLKSGNSFISYYDVYPKVTIVKGIEKSIGRIVMVGDNAQNIEINDTEETVIKKGNEVFIIKCKMS